MTWEPAKHRLLFVGERRSTLARTKEWTWHDNHVCAGTLHRALIGCGIDATRQVYVNAFTDDGEPWPLLGHVCELALSEGGSVVALGARADRRLRSLGVPHLRLVHPAARGAIRRTDVYKAHVAAVLQPVLAQSEVR